MRQMKHEWSTELYLICSIYAAWCACWSLVESGPLPLISIGNKTPLIGVKKTKLPIYKAVITIGPGGPTEIRQVELQ